MFANSQLGGTTFGFPDVCMTPSPLGLPMPLPYTSTAAPAVAFPAAYNMLFSNTPAQHLGTTIPATTGAEPGILAGVVSRTYLGPARALTGSSTVLADGHPATRMGSVSVMNATNCQGATIVPSQLKVVILAT